MSDTSQGDGWWQANDGKWYAPGSYISPRSVVAPPSPAAATTMSKGAATMVGAGVLVAIGSILPWATVTSAFGTISKDGTSGDGVITLIAGLAALACGLGCFRAQKNRAAVAVLGIVLFIICAGRDL